MNCGFRRQLYCDTLECIVALDSLREYDLKRIILKRFSKKYEVDENIVFVFFDSKFFGKLEDSKEKSILFQDIANKFCDYYMEIKMKNCCNCCKNQCSCKKDVEDTVNSFFDNLEKLCRKCFNKKDDAAIKIDVEKEIEEFTAHLERANKFNLEFKVSFNKNKIKNTPTIEIRCSSTKSLVDYIEDCLTSNHREFSLDEKIEAIKHLNRFITLRTEVWFNGLKNAIR